MDESVGKGPDRIENEEWQSWPKLDASEGVADDFARYAAGQAMTSPSAGIARDEPGQAAPDPATDAILPRSLRLAMIAAPLAAAAAIGSFVGSLAASGVTQFWPRVAPRTCGIIRAQDIRRRGVSQRQSTIRHAGRSPRPDRARAGRAKYEACSYR